MSENKFLGKKVKLYGEIIEYLELGKKEWFTVELSNGQKVTISKKLCEIIQ